MDTKTGDIFQGKTLEEMLSEGVSLKEMVYAPTVLQLRRKPVHPQAIGRVGRNDPCPCGSGKKFKKCCLRN